MTEVSRIHLCRHGEVDPVWKGRVYGGLDVELSDAGRQRFDLLASALRHVPLSAIYASDLMRARDGAERIAAAFGMPVTTDARLREIGRGSWAGEAVDDIEARAPGSHADYFADPDGYRGHGGETHADLLERVRPALIEIAERHVGQEVLIVCHGQVMRVVVAWILEIPGPASFSMMTGHGGLTTIDRYPDGAWVVQAVNAPTVREGRWGGRTYKP
jgi:broad specificity phosphatase PhoE